MDILINSLYTHKDIMVRELISNANDALDKIRFLSLQDPGVLDEGGDDLEIRISHNKNLKQFSIHDSGIGMTKEDLIQNLGTVAKSGTTQFIEALQSSGDMNLIGQFGVGFYSAFLVADKVIVQSKHNDDPVQHIWESTANSSFVVYDDPAGNTLKRGTNITLFLKEDAVLFSEQEYLEKVIKRYSEFIMFPIYLQRSRLEIEEDEEATAKMLKEREEKAARGEKEEELPPGAPREKVKTRGFTYLWWERMNEQLAIWTRNPSEVTEKEYKDFYKTLSKDGKDPLSWAHFKAEGEIEFKSIVYIPSEIPSDLQDSYYGKSSAMRLYVKKVLIADKFDDFMPRYLRFIRGVVDSDDLPLQVSREQIQQNKILDVIRKKLVRKILDIIRDLSRGKLDPASETKETKYEQFWKLFGKNIKLGIIEDEVHRNKLLKLARFLSTKSIEDGTETFISLDEYIKRMPDWQRSIFYIAGPDLETLKQSPFLERAKARGVEVLLFTDPTDEYMTQHIPDYDGRKLQAITKEGIKFGDETDNDAKKEKYYKNLFSGLTTFMEKSLYGKVEKVIVSQKVGKGPALLTTSQFGYTANQERLAKSRAFGDASQLGFMRARKVLEINPLHPIIVRLKEKLEGGEKSTAEDLTRALYDSTSVASGFDIEEIKEFNQRMSRLMKAGLGLDSLELVSPVDPDEIDEAVLKQRDADEEVDIFKRLEEGL